MLANPASREEPSLASELSGFGANVIDYRRWAGRITQLAAMVRGLEPVAAELGLPLGAQTQWYGALFQMLLPQACQEPFLIAAVTGGTNTGKSVVFNHLAGSAISRSHPNATQTRHPVCVVPQGFRSRDNLAAVFPDFQVRPWSNENDPLADGSDHLLFVRDDRSGRQPPQLLLLDTPDVDGTLKVNWRRAELVRHAADVLVCVLTQQKYNDAAIREFFEAAAEADKTVVIVFNMVHWPRQRETCLGWLEQFSEQTRIQPAAAYAVPWDPEAAEQNRLPFHPLTDRATDLRADLAELQFDAIKIRSLAGSLRRVVDRHDGLPAYLSSIRRRGAEYAAALELLDHDIRREDVELPDLPRRLVWDEIWAWLDARRTRFDRWVHGGYRWLGELITRPWRADPAEALEDFRRAELDRLKAAMAAKLDQLERLRRGGNSVLASELDRALGGLERARLFTELELRHQAAPLVTDGYRQFIRQQLDGFQEQNPALIKGITWALVATAVVRPAISIGLAAVGAHGMEMAAGHWAISWVGDVAVGTATAAAGEAVAAPTGHLALKALLGGLFARFYEERVKLLTKTLDDLVLGPVVEHLDRLAKAREYPELAEAGQIIELLRTPIETSADTAHRSLPTAH
jgi:hypothetical protein